MQAWVQAEIFDSRIGDRSDGVPWAGPGFPQGARGWCAGQDQQLLPPRFAPVASLGSSKIPLLSVCLGRKMQSCVASALASGWYDEDTERVDE